MKNTYVLVEGKNVELSWRLLCENHNVEMLEEQQSRYEYHLGASYLHDKISGLNLDNLGDYMNGYSGRIQKWLDKGHTVLINKVGGFMLLTDSISILDKKEFDFFPTLEGQSPKGLNGWLSPAGKFYACEPSEHHLFANSYEGSDKDQFLKLSSSKYDMKRLSDVGIIDENNITVAQFNWFKKHKPYFDDRQMELLIEHKVF